MKTVIFVYLITATLKPYNFQNGESALHAASSFGHLGVVKLLLHAGANSSLKNHDGVTPMDLAISSKHNNIVEYLRLNA